jgi:hypothetical protein
MPTAQGNAALWDTHAHLVLHHRTQLVAPTDTKVPIDTIVQSIRLHAFVVVAAVFCVSHPIELLAFAPAPLVAASLACVKPRVLSETIVNARWAWARSGASASVVIDVECEHTLTIVGTRRGSLAGDRLSQRISREFFAAHISRGCRRDRPHARFTRNSGQLKYLRGSLRCNPGSQSLVHSRVSAHPDLSNCELAILR